MASPVASSAVFLVVLVATLAAGTANAAIFTITNRCSFTVWPAATPVGGGVQLNPGQTWTINVPAGTSSGRVWGRTGCSFNGAGRGSCATGDCGGALSCTLSGQPPLTLAEFTIGLNQDFYDLSVIDGYNVGMSFSCSSGVGLTCRDRSCPDAYQFPNDRKTHACSGNSNYQVVFCP
uniref:Thaumatin-like protein n=1 Tax=Oryza punctata TaxID=4537 RepID=A0A0E0MPV5_ORYPU